MKNIWTTKEGKEIKYKDLEDSHLLNILRYVKKSAKELDGELIDGGGDSWDVDSMWAVEGSEEDWLEKFDYTGLTKEALKRGLLSHLQEIIKLKE